MVIKIREIRLKR